MRFNILFNNVRGEKDFQTLWGFSCYIPELNLLFDTGSNGRVLLQNAKKMGIDFKEIKYLFISHHHWDHIGGIDTVIEENPNITMFVPSSLSKHLIKDLKSLVKEVIVVNDKFSEILPNVYTTGIMQPLEEQSMAIDTPKGLIIITGCGHAGIINIQKRIKENLNKEIYYILGGFHLLRSSDKEIQEVIQNSDTKFISPTHCTGEKAIKMIKTKFQDNFIKAGVGNTINLPNLCRIEK
jgi:7,8-dihydropterin-6-yl-methyl-4-(beta-D-ribofuranosyl)aminobenzene 5'-phosphate synthase